MTQTGSGGSVGRDQTLAVATAFLALFSIVGFALYGLPFFYDFFFRDLGWSRQQVTSGNAYSKVFVAVSFGFVAGLIVDRFGPKRIMIVGILIAGAALVGLSQVTTLSAFYFFYVLNALGYVFGGPLPNQVMLSGWFDKARGRAMGIAYLGIGAGGMIVPLLAHQLIQALGWRGALRALGVIMIVVALPCALFVREPARPGGAGQKAGSIRDFIGRPAFYLLAVGSMASIGAVGGTIQNLKFYLAGDRQIAQGDIAQVMSIILGGSIVGRLLMGWLADRWPKKHVMFLIYTIVAAAIPLMVFAPTPGLLKLFAFLFGVGLGGDYMIIPLMAAELFGLRILGRVMGVVLTADSVAEAMVPMGVATVRDQTGTYAGGFLLLTGLAAIGALAVAFLPRKPDAAEAPPVAAAAGGSAS
jgi:sugar phosphate permease